MGTCKWMPPEDAWGADKYKGCPHEPHGDSDYCIFHIPLEEKRNNLWLANAFEAAFNVFFDDRILKDGTHDFQGFVLPDGTDLSWVDFRRSYERDNHDAITPRGHPPISFRWATFGDNAYFWYATFGAEADFIGATFGDNADWGGVTFGDNADFGGATFGDNADFVDAAFGNNTDFHKAKIGDNAVFDGAIFGNCAGFGLANFGNKSSFFRANFGNEAYFWKATFGIGTSFLEVTLGDNSDFNQATFMGLVDFRGIIGRETALYGRARQKDQKIIEIQAELFRQVPAKLVFRETLFRGFALFQESDLSRTRFQEVDLSNLTFFNSQIGRTRFISCRWGSGPESNRYARRTLPWPWAFRRSCLLLDELLCRDQQIEAQEEIIKRKLDHSLDPQIWLFNRLRLARWQSKHDLYIRQFRKTPDMDLPPLMNIQPSDIEVLGLQLKQSLEATKDPIAAGDFHFAVMEMKRMRAMAAKHWIRAFMFWLYKMVNGYGEHYARTLMWLGMLLSVAIGVFALCGQEFFGTVGFEESLQPATFFALQHVFPFKFGAELWKIENAGWLMRWLTLAETFIGSSLFTFMILAMRRRFKR